MNLLRMLLAQPISIIPGLDLGAAKEPNILGPVVPVLKIMCICVFGFFLTNPRFQVLNPQACKVLSKLVFALFLPCLIFTELGKSVTLHNMKQWWFIPVNVLLSYAIGCFFGYLVALICRPPPQFFRFTIVMTGIGNTGNIPLSIVESVCHGWNQFGTSCKTSGVAYVSFAQWVAIIVVYIFAYHMLEPPKDYYFFYDEVRESLENGGQGSEEQMPDFVEAEWPGVKDAGSEATRTPFLDRIFRKASFNERAHDVHIVSGGSDAEEDIEKVRCLSLREPRVVRKMRIVAERTPLQHLLQPPTVASLLAILVGSISGLRSFMFGEDAPLGFFTDGLTILGDAMVPCTLLVLGGMFSEGPAKSELGLKTLIGIGVTRLVVLPAVGFGVVMAASKAGFLLQGDKMFTLVLLLQHTMPSSILMAALTSLRGYGDREASAVLFWQHICSVVTIAGYIALYFKYVSDI